MGRKGGEGTLPGWQIAAESVGRVDTDPSVLEADGRDEPRLIRGKDAHEARARIRAVVSIAAGHGSSVSTEELHALLPAGSFEDPEAVERFVAEDEVLSQELQIQRGEIFPRQATDLMDRRAAQRRLTADRMRLADTFAARLDRVCPGLDLVAVSGSTAFNGTKPEDDVDFFVVTRRRRMWITLLLSMAMSKLDRIRDPRTPTFCFNRVSEREACVASFAHPEDALFAREALSLKVIRGRAFFHRLLEIAGWIDDSFPNLYRTSLAESAGAAPSAGRNGSAAWSVANLVAFLGLAPYLWLAGLVRNVRLQRQGRADALFRTIVSFRFFSYESRKFELLRQRYAREF